MHENQFYLGLFPLFFPPSFSLGLKTLLSTSLDVHCTYSPIKLQTPIKYQQLPSGDPSNPVRAGGVLTQSSLPVVRAGPPKLSSRGPGMRARSVKVGLQARDCFPSSQVTIFHGSPVLSGIPWRATLPFVGGLTCTWRGRLPDHTWRKWRPLLPAVLPGGPPANFRRAGGRALLNDLVSLRSAGGGGVWMEASTPGRARRGRAAGAPLSRAAVVLLLSAFVGPASQSGEASAPALPPRAALGSAP